MGMGKARVLVVVVGLLVPYLARVPGGTQWLAPYLHPGWQGTLLLAALGAVTWVPILGFSLGYRRPVSLVLPCVLGFGFLAWAHGTLDLTADAQSALALLFIPIYSLLPVLIGCIVSLVTDGRRRGGSGQTA